jgi:hypothetical protein
VSSGSACTSASLEPSYVLRALGVQEDMAHTSIRYGLGRFTTEEEVDRAVELTVSHVGKLREMSPLWEMVQVRGLSAVLEWAGTQGPIANPQAAAAHRFYLALLFQLPAACPLAQPSTWRICVMQATSHNATMPSPPLRRALTSLRFNGRSIDHLARWIGLLRSAPTFVVASMSGCTFHCGSQLIFCW